MSCPLFVFDGTPRRLTLLPPSRRLYALPQFSDHYRAADPGKIPDCRVDTGLPIFDQGPHSSCGGFTAGEVTMALHALRGGEFLRLSCTYPYAKANHGVDEGVDLGELVLGMKRWGTPPLDYFPESALFDGQGSPEADARAARFRWANPVQLANFTEAADWVSHGGLVVCGVAVCANFTAVDADGVVPAPAGQLLGYHALMRDEVWRDRRGNLTLGGPNHWGTSYGVAGRMRLGAEHFGTGMPLFGVRELVPDPLSDAPAARAA